jgi:hypothetical protein
MGVRFKLSDTFTVKDVAIPIADADEMTLDAIFKRKTYSECQALKQRPDIEVANEVLVGWKAVDEETNQDVPFNADTKAALLSVSSAAYHVSLAFFRSSQGTAAKNL